MTGPESSALATDCKTGQDANTRDDCRILGYVNSIQAYWTDEFAASNETYVPVKTVLFSGATQSGCGTASAATGPFYCPTDKLVYLDLGFFDELRTKYGAPGRLVRPGLCRRPRVRPPRPGPPRDPRQPAGAGRGRAGRLGPDGAAGRLPRRRLGQPCREPGSWQPLTAAQIADGLDAAAAVGDDRIQEATNGRVDPEGWTHGSSEQRQHWFTTGYQGGSANDCDTFSGAL